MMNKRITAPLLALYLLLERTLPAQADGAMPPAEAPAGVNDEAGTCGLRARSTC